jgi:hypothetical protein
LYKHKIVGSIYLFRTLGKLYLNVFFFYPILHRKTTINFRKKILGKRKISSTLLLKEKIKPIIKYKKYLITFIFFYNLELLLGIQVYFKFINICNPIRIFNARALAKIVLFLYNKFVFFKHQFRENNIYSSTILVLTHLFKFKQPDSLLLANYISSILSSLYKHTAYLSFLKKLLQVLQIIFNFRGIKILLSGKLNGFSRAQSKFIQVGRITLQNVDFPYMRGVSSSFTKAGKIGVKVWIC